MNKLIPILLMLAFVFCCLCASAPAAHQSEALQTNEEAESPAVTAAPEQTEAVPEETENEGTGDPGVPSMLSFESLDEYRAFVVAAELDDEAFTDFIMSPEHWYYYNGLTSKQDAEYTISLLSAIPMPHSPEFGFKTMINYLDNEDKQCEFYYSRGDENCAFTFYPNSKGEQALAEALDGAEYEEVVVHGAESDIALCKMSLEKPEYPTTYLALINGYLTQIKVCNIHGDEIEDCLATFTYAPRRGDKGLSR